MVRPWTWDSPDENRFDSVGHPSNWDSRSLFSDFLCAHDQYETIVNKSLLEFSSSEETTMELFAIMKRSSATAEGTYWFIWLLSLSCWGPRITLTMIFHLAFRCGPLSLAALKGDSEKMKLLLTQCPNGISELNLLEQTPLHLAIGHAPCVSLLLSGSGRSLLDRLDSGGRRPVEYALFLCLWQTRAHADQYNDGCSKNHGDSSLNTLLDAGCMIPKRTLWLGTFIFNFSLCKNCLHAFSLHLSGRRESLRMLAKSHLPGGLLFELSALKLESFFYFSSATSWLGGLPPGLLDCLASSVVQELIRRGISVPLSLRVDALDGNCDKLTSVYHSYGPLPFSVLWKLGFRDLDQRDTNGLTPLMFWCNQDLQSLARCSWLVEKGANVHKLVPHGSSTVGHELYSKIGQLPPPLDDSEFDLRNHVCTLTTRLLIKETVDTCHCACSHRGCAPFTRFLQTAFAWRNISSPWDVVKRLPEIIAETHASVTKGQMKSAIRYATFEMLGIRHTCCHSDVGRALKEQKEEDEIEELRQEDSFLVAILDDLVKKLEWELQGQLLRREVFDSKSASFWNKHWLPRVQVVLESLNNAEIRESERVAAEDVGVKWQKQESGTTNDNDGDYNNGSEDGRYNESEWKSDVDEGGMFERFQTMEDWTSRLNLIMSKAGL